MTQSLALAHLLLASSSKSTSSSSAFLTLLPLLAIGVLGYFFFIKPQQRKAQAARAAQGSGIEVGDEVQTVGGVIGTVLEIHGDRYTLLTGALGDDGNLDGPQPTRIVFVRQAIAKKIEPIEDIRAGDDAPVDDVRPSSTANGSGAKGGADSDIDDVGGDNAPTTGEHGGEAEEA
jgi:preprotein translocase YajC subunit